MKKKEVTLQGELAFNHVLITRDTFAPSILITSLDKRNSARDVAMKDVQTVVKVGPFVKGENGINIKEGDKVLLDISKLQAKNARALTLPFDKETGAYADNWDGKDEKNVNLYVLITDREILMKV